MKEINRHILINGLSDLPEHKAPFVIWENIDAMMFSIPIQALPVHKPPTTIWAAIETGISGSMFSRKLIIRSVIILLLLLIAGGTNHYIGNHSNNNNIKNEIPSEQSSIIPSTYIEDSDNTEFTKIEENNYSKTITNPNIENKLLPESSISDNSILNNELENNNEIVSSIESRLLLSQKALLPKNFSKALNNYMESLIPVNNNLSDYEGNMPNIIPQYCDFNQVEKSIVFGPGIDYQYFLSSSIPENTTMKYWVSGDFRARFQRERLTIETGIGISFSEDKAKFNYDYLTNELVDTYEYVDSVHFDPITGTTEYFTTTVEVYDSIPHISNSSVVMQYTYLQIPLIIGYNILNTNTLCINIHAGIVYNSEINSKETLPTIYHENSRITSIGSNNTQRNKQLLNITGGIGFDWRTSKNFIFSLSPSFNYYTNHIYQNSNSLKQPISIGIRLGLYYKF
ncbi:MAG: hypothetical protein HQ521_09145 [Bacteroidetes bacterium]|nr:hypothetical protein [Bacteroidota bacterium]